MRKLSTSVGNIRRQCKSRREQTSPYGGNDCEEIVTDHVQRICMKVYVSLTTIKQNEASVVETLQSVAAQTQLPDKCFIFLSETPYLLDPGFKNGTIGSQLSVFLKSSPLFELRWCPNTGPFRKLLPLLEEKFDENCLIVTIDDDTVYTSTFLEKIVGDFNRYKCCTSN